MKEKDQMKEKYRTQLLAFLFGGIFTAIFLYFLFKLIYRIYKEIKRNRMNRNRRHDGLLLANSLYHIT